MFCRLCEKERVYPLFLIVDRNDVFPICHTHVDSILDKRGAAATLGPWEAQLSGDTWLVKVRR